ncbi:hypothetical protein CI238_07717 [Colletotrichum incanum]|uniref:Uncharacterized protein n=1 Tax=Colletotrichum incanum TaxID=1573173 RepID=A0A167DCV0_COLIC|nr:hypothetical protein CI238_07717 [Colletotrichum incanum]
MILVFDLTSRPNERWFSFSPTSAARTQSEDTALNLTTDSLQWWRRSLPKHTGNAARLIGVGTPTSMISSEMIPWELELASTAHLITEKPKLKEHRGLFKASFSANLRESFLTCVKCLGNMSLASPVQGKTSDAYAVAEHVRSPSA